LLASATLQQVTANTCNQTDKGHEKQDKDGTTGDHRHSNTDVDKLLLHGYYAIYDHRSVMRRRRQTHQQHGENCSPHCVGVETVDRQKRRQRKRASLVPFWLNAREPGGKTVQQGTCYAVKKERLVLQRSCYAYYDVYYSYTKY